MGSDNGNVNTKKSSKRVKFKDEFGSSGSESSGHSREGSGSSNYSDAHLEITNRVEGTNSNGLGTNPEIIHKGEDDGSGESSLFSSSSCSSTDDQSRADTKVATSILKKGRNGSAGSTSESQLSTIVPHESTLTQSPPIQVMDRQAEDLNLCRIPSVVFGTSKSAAHRDWSNASNDSLFSIKVGGTSFARDQILNKRSELSKGECMELVPSSFFAPMVDTKNFKSDVKETEVSDVFVKDKTFTVEEPVVEKSKVQVVPWEPPNISNRSDENSTSDCSLDPPGEKKNKNKEKCAWAFCYCSNYSCALCYCWNCSMKRWCCCSDSEDESNSPKKGKARQKQRQEEKHLASALKSKSACSVCKCCSWFPSCCRGKHCCC
ncbi:uncharacterized protein LOC120122125 [Hibiscus syriacus]|uniref:uncharacterized protein LOC120122125 n=1 Tax=Hibiscus syriacus TaxID=106335 RepID=UPI001922A9BE|nr:uncharacterized protein LOC120122125 [Hibiscus syriacus]